MSDIDAERQEIFDKWKHLDPDRFTTMDDYVSDEGYIHELMDRTHVILNTFGDHVHEHVETAADKKLFELSSKILHDLYQLYSEFGGKMFIEEDDRLNNITITKENGEFTATSQDHGISVTSSDARSALDMLIRKVNKTKK